MPKRTSGFTTVGREEFLRRAEARSLRIARQLQSVVRQTWTSPELLHDLHRQLRRGRLDLRVLRRGSRKDRREAYREADEALSELAQLTGHARDLDVSATLLRTLSSGTRWNATTRRGLEALQETIIEEARHARLDLRKEAMRWLRKGKAHLPPSVDPPDPKEDKRFASAAREEILRRDRDLRRAIVRAHRRPNSERLHQMRIALRRSRNLRAALAHESTPPEYPETWRLLQKELGEHHDLSVLDLWVARHRVKKHGPELRREIRRAIRSREDRAQKRLLQAMDDLEGKLPHTTSP